MRDSVEVRIIISLPREATALHACVFAVGAAAGGAKKEGFSKRFINYYINYYI